jgi:hypothetical protein
MVGQVVWLKPGAAAPPQFTPVLRGGEILALSGEGLYVQANLISLSDGTVSAVIRLAGGDISA